MRDGEVAIRLPVFHEEFVSALCIRLAQMRSPAACIGVTVPAGCHTSRPELSSTRPSYVRELYTRVRSTPAFCWRSCNPPGAWFSRLVWGAPGSNPGLESRALGRRSPPPCRRFDGNVMRRVYVGVDVIVTLVIGASEPPLGCPGFLVTVAAFVACAVIPDVPVRG